MLVTKLNGVLSMKVFFLLIGRVLFLSGVLVGCSSDNKNEGGGSLKETTFATYEMIEGCSTGVKKISANSAAELATALCDNLKNNEANGGCAQYQREQMFKTKNCAGNWPHASISGFNASNYSEYTYSTNACSTGRHFVSSSSSFLGKKAFCKLLMNEELNLNCGRVEREERYVKEECKAE